MKRRHLHMDFVMLLYSDWIGDLLWPRTDIYEGGILDQI